MGRLPGPILFPFACLSSLFFHIALFPSAIAACIPGLSVNGYTISCYLDTALDRLPGPAHVSGKRYGYPHFLGLELEPLRFPLPPQGTGRCR